MRILARLYNRPHWCLLRCQISVHYSSLVGAHIGALWRAHIGALWRAHIGAHYCSPVPYVDSSCFPDISTNMCSSLSIPTLRVARRVPDGGRSEGYGDQPDRAKLHHGVKPELIVHAPQFLGEVSTHLGATGANTQSNKEP